MSLDQIRLVDARDRNVSSIDEHKQFSKTVLRELFDLLEDYSPTWYTEAHHSRAAAALRDFPPKKRVNAR